MAAVTTIPLVKSDTNITAPDWSPDGQFLLYTDEGGPSRDLWTLPLSGDRKPKPFLATPFLEDHGKFSPDGRWIAYTSNASGRNEVYVRPFPAGEGLFKISRDGGREPRWRDDGRELFFLTLDGRLMAASIDTARGFQPSVPQPLFHTGFVALQNFGYDRCERRPAVSDFGYRSAGPHSDHCGHELASDFAQVARGGDGRGSVIEPMKLSGTGRG